ncbi:MAG: DUF4352 domain-containing protein [Deltaproteobacteria bacterium]|nr:DUF4352 domain-containing protein [Deltaproteobacteria bacterium]
MKKKNYTIISVCILLCLLLCNANTPAQHNSSKNPAAIGSPEKTMVELGSVYSSIYDITITLLETVRGKDAMALLETAGKGIRKPAKGFEYLLARVRFEMKARAISDKLTFELGDSPLQWVALASDLTEYPGVTITVPQPALKGIVKPGDSIEGWTAFAVDKGDKGPLMVFDPDTGGATGRGRPLFFKLFNAE